MRRLVVLSGILLLGCVTLGSGAPVGGRAVPRQQGVEPYGRRSYVATFKGKERACVIVKGAGQTYLGLYVYDEHGNCVARDDRGSNNVKDGLAVEWFPLKTAPYTVEVRNFGPLVNSFSLALR
jgi:hypothetical protein